MVTTQCHKRDKERSASTVSTFDGAPIDVRIRIDFSLPYTSYHRARWF